MKVKVCYTVEVNDRYRRAINAYFGKPGLASREDVQDFLKQNGATLDNDILFEFDAAEERAKDALSQQIYDND